MFRVAPIRTPLFSLLRSFLAAARSCDLVLRLCGAGAAVSGVACAGVAGVAGVCGAGSLCVRPPAAASLGIDSGHGLHGILPVVLRVVLGAAPLHWWDTQHDNYSASSLAKAPEPPHQSEA